MDKIVPKHNEIVPSMGARFWDDLYLTQTTAWDLGQVSPPLKAFIDQWEDKNSQILISGAGNAYEAAYLFEHSFQSITVLDLAPSLIVKLRKKFVLQPEVKIIEGNFFDHTGQYDLILEQTFFCALDPQLRTNYADKMYELLKPGGHLAGVLFNRPFEKQGPPFGGTLVEYENLFEEKFDIPRMEPCYNSHPARQGSELFIHFRKK